MREGQRVKQPNPVREEGRKQESKKAPKKKRDRERYAGNIRVLIVKSKKQFLLVTKTFLNYCSSCHRRELLLALCDEDINIITRWIAHLCVHTG